jgi:hypothetical protein
MFVLKSSTFKFLVEAKEAGIIALINRSGNTKQEIDTAAGVLQIKSGRDDQIDGLLMVVKLIRF